MKMYSVEKFELATGVTYNYGGGYTEKEIKPILKGYKYSKEFCGKKVYKRSNGKYVFYVKEYEA